MERTQWQTVEQQDGGINHFSLYQLILAGGRRSLRDKHNSKGTGAATKDAPCPASFLPGIAPILPHHLHLLPLVSVVGVQGPPLKQDRQEETISHFQEPRAASWALPGFTTETLAFLLSVLQVIVVISFI